jgi:3-methyladenine DNA glycosylase AlkD
MTKQTLEKEIKSKADPKRAELSQRYFKTGKGDYGEGDIFLGLTVPEQREIAKKYTSISLKDLSYFLKSKPHEFRFTALLILVNKYAKGDEVEKEKIVRFYLANLKYVNNWDLVDTSAPYILGPALLNRSKSVLYKLAKSKNLWERRVAIVSTLHFIKMGKYDDTLWLAKIYLNDKHDLIHKATGWALREVGKKSLPAEVAFLSKYHSKMPRVMFRYAIERFDSKLKDSFK